MLQYPTAYAAIASEEALVAATKAHADALRAVVEQYAEHKCGDRINGFRSASGTAATFVVRRVSAKVAILEVKNKLAICISYGGKEVKKNLEEGMIDCYTHITKLIDLA